MKRRPPRPRTPPRQAPERRPGACDPAAAGSRSARPDAAGSAASPSRSAPAAGRRRLTGWRRWAFPLITAVVVPALLLAMLEGGLRLAGYGFPASFLLPLDDGAALATNPRFGWRFFPPAVAREPVVARVAAEKPEGTVRLVVLGGSAAMGTPEADFNFGRVLETMLAEAFPGRRFEVINAAMAAVDSHVVRVVGREMARHQPDAFLLYLGNNEVVGPHGPGTVFGGFRSSLAAVRAGVRLRGTRTGQLLRGAAGSLGGGGREELRRWRGMEMFLERRVAAGDPRLDDVYAHLAANLDDLVDAAHGAGARTFLSTVAVNLVDEPPFASVHGPGLPAGGEERFAGLLDEGWRLLAEGRPAEALPPLERAVVLDDRHAAGRWLLGRALLAVGRRDEAAEHLAAARDLDALRFRADGGVERAIRRVAAERAADGVVLVDGAARVAGVAPGEPPLAGHDALWEHVHLTFEGNLRLARAFYDAVAPWIAGGGAVPEPTPAERIAERLALSAWDLHHMAREVLGIVRRPPFVGQLGHAERIAAFERSAARLAVAAWQGTDEAERLDRAALAARPDDLHVREQLARLLDERGRRAEAAEQWRELLRRVPGRDEWRTRLAFSLADAGQTSEARAILAAVHAERGDADSRVNLCQVVERAGDPAAAADCYRAALADQTAHEPTRLALADLLARRGSLDEAERLVRAALAGDAGSARARAALAALHERRGDLAAAAEAWRRVTDLDPGDAAAANNLGYALERLGRPAEAAEEYRRALAVDPTYALAYFNLGDLALRHGRAAEAARFYRGGLELAPGNEQARQNLALATEMAGSPGGG